MWRTGSLEKTLMLGSIESGRRGRQRMRWLDGITDLMDTGLNCISSVAQSCLTLCNSMDCSTHRASLSITNSRSLLKLMSIWVGDAMQPSQPLSFPSLPTFNLSQHQGLFQWVSSSYQVANASLLPMNIQDWFLLGLTRWISLLCKGLSGVFSSTAIQKYQFFGSQPSLWSSSHIHTWLLENHSFDQMDLCRQTHVSAF